MTSALQVPPLHHEPTASVMRILQLRECGKDQFKADSLPQFRETIYGGQVLGQAIMAAYATMDLQRKLHSMHAYFLRAGNAREHLGLHVDRIRDGGSFSVRSVQGRQGKRVIFDSTMSFQVPQEGLTHAACAPKVPDPDSVPDALEIFRHIDHPVARFLGKTVAFRARHVNGHLYLGPPDKAESQQLLWVQSRHRLPENTPQYVHQAFLAYVTDQFMLEPVLRSHQISWQNPSLAVATLDHAMWFHHDVNVNDWMLFVQDSPFAGGGRGVARTLIFSEEGTLLATVAQEGMVRMTKKSGSWGFYSDKASEQKE